MRISPLCDWQKGRRIAETTEEPGTSEERIEQERIVDEVQEITDTTTTIRRTNKRIPHKKLKGPEMGFNSHQ
jgi:hypothetical protein